MAERLIAASRAVDAQRRDFIRHSLTGGFAALVAANQTVLATQDTGERCGTQSLSEWLVTALAFVTQVTTEAYNKIVIATETQLETYKSAFDNLYCLLSALSAELDRSTVKASSQITQLQTLAEVGRVNGGFVRTALFDGESAKSLFLTLGLVSQEICAQAQNLPPAGSELTLSKQASGILKKIIELTRSEQFAHLHQGVSAAQSSSNTQKQEVNRLVSRLQLSISAAREAILLAENPAPKDRSGKQIVVDKAEQWRVADVKLADAIGAMQELITNKKVGSLLPTEFVSALPEAVLSPEKVKGAMSEAVTSNPDDALPVSDSLILGLGNCRRVYRLNYGLAKSASRGFEFIKTNYTSPVPVDRNAMAALLWNCCPPGSRDQIDRIDSIVAFVGGWNSWLPQAGRKALIGSALYWANRFHQFTCSGVRDLKTLASGLAELV